MWNIKIVIILALLATSGCGGESKDTPAVVNDTPTNVVGTPPYSGTIFVESDIISDSDPTAYSSIVSIGIGMRTMYDRRVSNWIDVNAYLFTASYSEGTTIEVQVNPEFGSTNLALTEATKYATAVGRLPTALRADVQTIWIHKGTQPFGGGNNNLLIHTGQADLYVAGGILEETLVHEASHTSLDATHAAATDWLAAQTADNNFISTYARDNPTREDVAESYLMYIAIRYRSNRISAETKTTVESTIPNRISYFDTLGLAMHPIQ